MRLIVAIVLLAISTASLAFGIAERVVFVNPETIDRSIVVDSNAPATIIHGKDLAAYPGRHSITIEGGVSARVPAEIGDGFEVRQTNQIFATYARTVDVLAWLSPARHTLVRYDAATDSLIALPRTGEELTLPNPAGSDLWFQEYSGTDSLTVSASVPSDVSLVIMSDGVLPAPTTITVSWPIANDSLLALVAIVVGVGTMIAGFVLLVLTIVNWRRTRGPRRRLTKRPRPRSRTSRPAKKSSSPQRGRRSMRFIALPLLGLVLVGATGCSNPQEPVEEDLETNESTPQAVAPYPAVTELQFSRIMSKVAAQIQLADEELSINTAAVRMAEPSLEARRANYIVKRVDAESGSLLSIPSSPIRLVLPQQTQTWPRTVFGIIQDEGDQESPSLGVVLRQETPRSLYQLTYSIVLSPQVQLPDLPAATLGAAKLSRDSKLTRIAPLDVLDHYSQVVNEGVSNQFATEFALATDPLFAVLGPDAQALRQESFGEAVEVTWEVTPLDTEIVAFGTADGGALVMGTLREVERVVPLQSGAAVNASILVRALTSLSQSVRGFEVQSNIQVLWYVPPVGSDEGIRVLGSTYNLVGAKEVDNE